MAYWDVHSPLQKILPRMLLGHEGYHMSPRHQVLDGGGAGLQATIIIQKFRNELHATFYLSSSISYFTASFAHHPTLDLSHLVEYLLMQYNQDMPENSERLQYYRLLEMLPAATLKGFMDQKGSRTSLIQAILDKKKHDDMRELLVATFPQCKQHVFLLSSNRKKASAKPKLNSDIESAWHQDHESNGTLTRHYLFKTSQHFINAGEGTSTTLTFLWPVKVVIHANQVAVHIIILERSTSSVNLGGATRRIKKHDDMDILNFIECDIANRAEIQGPLDINVGVKRMWKDGVVDSTRAQSKGSKSTKTEAMDDGLYLKHDLPSEYSNILTKPLLSTIFHVMKDEAQYGRKFIAEPTNGRVFFRSRSNAGQINNVLNYILRHN